MPSRSSGLWLPAANSALIPNQSRLRRLKALGDAPICWVEGWSLSHSQLTSRTIFRAQPWNAARINLESCANRQKGNYSQVANKKSVENNLVNLKGHLFEAANKSPQLRPTLNGTICAR